MSRDLGTIAQPVVDIAALAARVRAQHVELQRAEAREATTAAEAKKATSVAESARDEAAKRRLELGRSLVEARKAWPSRGPKAKGWGVFLKDAGIEERSARDWMALAGYMHHEVSEPGVVGSEIPTRREVAEARRQERLPEVVKSTPSEPIEDLTDEVEEEQEPLQVVPRPARQPHVYSDEERAEIRRLDIERFQPPKIETREDRTRELQAALTQARTAIERIRVRGVHLTDATTSDVDFEDCKRNLIAIVRFGLDELEAAGALEAPEPRQRHLTLLKGGNR